MTLRVAPNDHRLARLVLGVISIVFRLFVPTDECFRRHLLFPAMHRAYSQSNPAPLREQLILSD